MGLFWGIYSRSGYLWAFVTLLLDQLIKSFMLYRFFPSLGCDPIDRDLSKYCKYEFTPFVDYVMVWNEGISYGLFKQTSFEGQMILLGLAIAAVIALTIWLAQSVSLLPAVSIGLVIGGAIGNAIDRMVYGAVADFVSLHAYGFNWYVFNIADVAIVAGVVGLLYDALFPSRKNVSNAS